MLAYLKSFVAKETTHEHWAKINVARNILSSICDDDFEHKELLIFIVQQLSLMTKKKQARIFPPNVVIKAFLWHSLSPGLYDTLKTLFIIPGSRRLRQISADSLNRQTSFHVDHQYFKTRTSDLSYRDKHVILQIDEIYTARRIEYSGGQLIGITDSGAQAKTILAFLVRSLSSKFEDIVLLVPIDKMTAADLENVFLHVLEEMKEHVKIVGVATDNLATNR